MRIAANVGHRKEPPWNSTSADSSITFTCARDLEASKQFYRAILAALDRTRPIREGASHFSADELWIDRAEGPPSRAHLAFQARGPVLHRLLDG